MNNCKFAIDYGVKVPFDGKIEGSALMNNIETIPRMGGVYFFLNQKLGEYAYIGSTKNLRERVKTHLGLSIKYKNGNKNLKKSFDKDPNSFLFEYCILSDTKEHVEGLCIKQYQPLYNRYGR